MATEKKFFAPVLYPKDQNLKATWFIKYKVEDYINGGFKSQKYTGLLNRLNTVPERLALAAQYIQMMEAGDPLPDCQGLRELPADLMRPNNTNTNVIACCERYLKQCEGKVITGRMAKATYQHYKSKLGFFFRWLHKTNRERRAIGGIDKYDAEDFLLYLAVERKLCPYTINHYKSLLAKIWKDYRQRINNFNPWLDIKNEKHTVAHLKSHPIGLQNFILETLPAFDHTLWLFFQCIYYCAIRPHQELRRLKVKHLDLNKGVFIVPQEIAKNKKERQVIIYEKLEAQFIAAGYTNANPEHYLFSHNGPGEKMVGKNYFQRKWKAYIEHFEISAQYKLYGAKHTGGKKLTKKTNAYITQQHFDHSSLQVTQAYTDKIDKSELRYLRKEFPEIGYVAAN